MHMDSKKRRSFFTLLFSVGELKRLQKIEVL